MTTLLTYFCDLPLWFTDGGVLSWPDADDYEDDGTAHFKVTIKVERPSHDGYCSGFDYEDEDNAGHFSYTSETLTKIFPRNTWDVIDFTPTKFSFIYGCTTKGGVSQVCHIPTHVTLVSIESVN